MSPGGDPGAAVGVTTRDMYLQLLTLSGEVRDVNTLLRERIAPTYVDHESRLRALERWRYALPTSFIIGTASLVVSVVLALWGH